MTEKYDPSAIWVALSEYGDGNLFNVYPRILSDILLQDEAERVEGDTSEAEKLVLPSDKEYRLQKYFMLVTMQKTLDLDEVEEATSLVKSENQSEEWAPWSPEVPIKNPNAPPPVVVRTSPGPAWDIKQVLKAACLLYKPPKHVDFRDEQEMRHVYSVIYDVFRYKTVLDQAIDDVEFFDNYPLYVEYRQTVWLFLMELARRRWSARPRGELENVTQLLEDAGSPFVDIEKTIWEQRVHFAAAVARIRIKNKAFELSELLPPHLRDERLLACVHKLTVTGWVNTFKTKKIASLVKRLHELGYSYSSSRMLCAGEYRFDRVCPRFITLRPPGDASAGQLELIKDGVIVLQEREFCEGASTLCRALRVNELRGVVAQTHASSPRCSAYLAAQLRELATVLRAKGPSAPATPELGKLVVFGAGDNVESYVESLKHLGIEASMTPQADALVCVYSDPIHCETPDITSALDGVVAVLATPPNSYTAVTDPIDLVCGRGGDLTMLEVLTESEIDSNGKARVKSILEEQKKTLKAILSKPQIQLILYETHSSLEAENQAQITRAVAEANRLAREKHTIFKKKPRDPQHPHSGKAKDMSEAPLESSTSFCNTISRSDVGRDDVDEVSNFATNSESGESSPKKIRPLNPTNSNFALKKLPDLTPGGDLRPRTTKAKPIPIPDVVQELEPMPKDPDNDSPDVVVPNCDLFEIGTLPNLGNGLDINYILDRDGCYLGLIQRKEITRLDAKYMIKVAEERGLFGAAPESAPPRRKKNEQAASALRRRRRKTSFEVERIAAPTHASMVRSSCRRGSAPAEAPPGVIITGEETHVCEKHMRRLAAATAITTASCTCDARHRQHIRRRVLTDAGKQNESPRSPRSPTSGGCRRPFPVAVHDLQLRTILTHRKVFAS